MALHDHGHCCPNQQYTHALSHVLREMHDAISAMHDTVKARTPRGQTEIYVTKQQLIILEHTFHIHVHPDFITIIKAKADLEQINLPYYCEKNNYETKTNVPDIISRAIKQPT